MVDSAVLFTQHILRTSDVPETLLQPLEYSIDLGEITDLASLEIACAGIDSIYFNE